MKTGTVKFWSKSSWGIITGDDGAEFFVHQSAIVMEGYRELVAGLRVRFEIEPAEKGPLAVNVRPIGYFTSDQRKRG